jgi:S1-C subfamily serine protease
LRAAIQEALKAIPKVPDTESPVGEPDAFAGLFTRLQSSIVHVRSGGVECTGFFVSEGTIVVPSFGISIEPNGPPSEAIKVAISSGTRKGVHDAELVKRSTEQHLALIRVSNAKGIEALHPAHEELHKHQEVGAIGYAGSSKQLMVTSVGRVVDSIETEKGVRIATTIQSRPGMAGAPVVNSQSQLVGMVEASEREAGICWIIPVSRIKAFLDADRA